MFIFLFYIISNIDLIDLKIRMILIEILFKEIGGLKNELAKNLGISNSSINITLKNKGKIRIGTKIKWTTGINKILNTNYIWNDLFEVKEEDE